MSAWQLRLAQKMASVLPTRVSRWLYRLGPVTALIRATLNRAAPEGETEVRIAAGLLAGARFPLNLKAEKDLWLGTYEVELQKALRRAIRPGMIVYDLGANIGYLTVGLARLVGPAGHVHAFEAHPGNVDRLGRAVRLNGLTERVTIVPNAVGRTAGTHEFLLHPSGGMGKLAGSGGRQAVYEDSIEVKVVTLDAYFSEEAARSPAWVKVDVEGGEVAVLAGAARMLQEVRPGFFLEIHGPQAARRVWDLLQEGSYRLTTLSGDAMAEPANWEWKSYLAAVPAERAGEWHRG